MQSRTPYSHEWASYTSLLAVWPTLHVQSAPVLPDLKGAFSQLLFTDPPTGVEWDLGLDSLLVTSVQCSVLAWTIPGCFLKCLGSLFCCKTQLSDTGLNIALQNALVISLFHDAMHTIKAPSARGSTATPKHHWSSSMFDCREGVLFFEGFIFVPRHEVGRT